MKNRQHMRIMIVLIFLWTSLAFAMEARANGNVSADEIPKASAEPVRPDANRSVRKAPVRRPPKKTPSKKNAARKVTQPKPRRVSSLERGIALMNQRRYEEARSWLQKAVEEEQKNPYAWYWYGLAHDKVGQYQQAQFFYARAATLDPEFPPLSRLMFYPDEGNRVPLWDPQHRARLYQVETNYRGVEIVPPGSPETTRRPIFPEPPLAPGTLYPPYPPATPDQLGARYHMQPVYVPPPPPYSDEAPEAPMPPSPRP